MKTPTHEEINITEEASAVRYWLIKTQSHKHDADGAISGPALMSSLFPCVSVAWELKSVEKQEDSQSTVIFSFLHSSTFLPTEI